MPPAATTGTRSPTASTTWGTSAIVATWPVWPPASVPWATTMSQPASTAAIAWATLPHMLTTSRPPSWHCSTTSRGTPSPATNTVAPPSIMSATFAAMSWGAAVSRSTPKGLSVSAAVAAISVDHLLGAHGRRAEAAEAAGLGDRGDHPVVGDTAHAGEHDGVFDVQHLGQSRAHGGDCRCSAATDPVRDRRGYRRVGAQPVPERARPGDGTAPPAPRCRDQRPRVVLEQPAGEVASRPVVASRRSPPHERRRSGSTARGRAAPTCGGRRRARDAVP